MARLSLEAQQRYFSYRAILVAIVSQSCFVLVFVGYRIIIARYVAKWGIAQMCLCEPKDQGGGVSHHFGGTLNSLKKYRAIWGIAAIVSQYRAIWGHDLEDRNLLKLRKMDPSCPFFLSENSIWGQRTQMLQML